MSKIDSASASKALGTRLSQKFAKAQTVTSGYVSTVTNDSNHVPKTATVIVAGGTVISVPIPYGSVVMPGASISIVNEGSPSLASWRLANTVSQSPILVGGQIINTNGGVITNFDSIWVKDRGYLMAGGFEDILGIPTGPRVVINEYGFFGYAIEFAEPVVSIHTIAQDDRLVGDVLIGYKRPSHANLLISPEQGKIEFSVEDTPFLVINGTNGNRLEGYMWFGSSTGPQIGVGNMLGVAEIAMRDTSNRYVYLVRSDPMRVQIGATDDANYLIWDSGLLSIKGSVIADSVWAASGVIGGWVINADGLVSRNGAVSLHSESGIVLDAVIARFDAASLKWSGDGIDYLALGTDVDLGSVTGSVIRSNNSSLFITGDEDIYVTPGIGYSVILGGIGVGESGDNYASISNTGAFTFYGTAGISGYLPTTGAVTGATAQAQTFTNGAKLGDGATNYAEFNSTGHLTFNGTGKPWNDMLIEPTARTTGVNAPTFEKWYDDAAGTSRGVYLYSFDDAASNAEKEVFFTLQMSHSWDGGDIQFHVHWIGAVSDTEATPLWGLEYVFKEPGAVYGDSVIVYGKGNHLNETDITAHKHYITQFTAISPGSTANDLSSVLIGRLFRSSSSIDDTYNASGAKCGLLYIDAHYQIARIGSTDEYSA